MVDVVYIACTRRSVIPDASTQISLIPFFPPFLCVLFHTVEAKDLSAYLVVFTGVVRKWEFKIS